MRADYRHLGSHRAPLRIILARRSAMLQLTEFVTATETID